MAVLGTVVQPADMPISFFSFLCLCLHSSNFIFSFFFCGRYSKIGLSGEMGSRVELFLTDIDSALNLHHASQIRFSMRGDVFRFCFS